MADAYDVAVVGGGTAGVVAAIQAGRAGARTVLIEKNGMLGGTMTIGGVPFPALFYAWGQQVIAGIGWELVRRTLEATGDVLPDMTDPSSPTWRKHIRINPAIFAALCDEAVLGAGVELMLHSMPAGIHREEGGWQLDVCTKSGLEAIDAKVLIDATGDANAVSLAGFEVDRAEPAQPGTLAMRCGGYDVADLDAEGINAAARQAVEDGRLAWTDVGWRAGDAMSFLRGRGANNNHVVTFGSEASVGKTRAEVEARRAMMRMYRFYRSQPGLERFTIETVMPECGIRESVVIRGKGRITEADYVAGRAYDDAVCYCFYPIDIHLHDGEGIDYRPLPEGVLPTIPRSAMLPAASEFLIVAGRCISGDREAHSAYRVEAPCMAMGQAAGAMAVLSARSGVDPETLAMDEVHALLRAHGAIVPGDVGQPQ